MALTYKRQSELELLDSQAPANHSQRLADLRAAVIGGQGRLSDEATKIRQQVALATGETPHKETAWKRWAGTSDTGNITTDRFDQSKREWNENKDNLWTQP